MKRKARILAMKPRLHSLRVSAVTVRKLQVADRQPWLVLRQLLWRDSGQNDAEAWLVRKNTVVLVAASASGEVVGFAEVGLRLYADGCNTSPVAFLEGWYVRGSHRRTGVGSSLVRAAVEWARQQGVRELASDSPIENASAYAAHLGVGFEEVERSIKYRMVLGQLGRNS